MKPSEIKWIKEIPKHWENKKLKFLTKFDLSTVNRHTNDNQPKVSICHYPQVYNNEKITKKTELSEGTCSEKELQKFQIKKDDVLITKDSETRDDIGVPVYIVENLKNTVSGYHIAHITPNKTELSGLFFFRYLQSNYTSGYFETEANGVTRYGLGKGSIGNLKILFPSIVDEQIEISNFLEAKISKIDLKISTNKKLVKFLKEKKQTEINHVMTQGLDPSIKLRDSEIDWIGNIPEHWKICRIKHYTSKITSGSTPKGGAEIYEDSGIPLLRSQNIHFDGLHLDDVAYINEEIYSKMFRTQLEDLDVLLNITGASIGRCTYVPESFGKGNVNQHVCIIRTSSKLFYGFLHMFLMSDLIQNWIHAVQMGASREGLTFEDIGNLPIPIFEQNEQKQITSFLQHEISKIDSLVSNLESQIQKLQEYRQSLISNAVTGQIDVRCA
jgi:type I restriction enzyme S subunit